MQNKGPYIATFLAVAIVGLAFAVPAAPADSMSLDTGAGNEPWMVTRTLIGGESQPNLNGGDAAGDSETYTAVDVLDPVYPSWVQASSVGDGKAQWISFLSTTGTNYSGDNEKSAVTNDGTSYVYTDTFTLTGAANASIEVSGALLAADNVITGVSLEDVSVAENVPLNFTDNSLNSTNYYHVPSTFSTAPNSGLFQSSPLQTFTLTVDVVNWDGSRFDTPGPTGFLLDGTAAAVPVPLPATAGVGVSMLAGFGALAALRKRLGRRSRIA